MKLQNMENYFIEIMGIVLTIGGLAIAYISLRHKFKTEEQSRHKSQIDELVAHNEWRKNIEFDIATIKKETAEIRHEREKQQTDIWQAIKAIQSGHDTDMKEVNSHIGELIKEIKQKNESDHCELKELLTSVNDAMIELKTDFRNHKETHDLVKKSTRTR
jgi:hypothetical protein